ncbi:bridge-like lipid transfer protein family member 3B isoform X2 [Drosophila tropicalis]|uniref:bridge-like lipid transfer protein family member 3B isoform X2 n=1 Tax=Drosophila tropicalis TaxID=46794 RepID=UPI0035AC0017
MVSLIKNQLLKHLSIYTKNLSSDKINLSTFRGEGELSNLELDERVLTELLELPSWLRLTSAWCNHVSFRISWTKLKSVPITLTLDEVRITIETCQPNTRDAGGGAGGGGNGSPPTAALPQVPQGKYSFIHKVVDGITIVVNTVNVNFVSAAFTASVQMSRIRVESKTPKWANADLRLTRLKDPQKGIILIFKELSWQTVRIEASSTQDTSLTPLRLLTNHARCRITIRKRLSDCTLLASRLVLILDDLLWVLTDSQLKAALHFVDSLSGLIKAATHATQKSKAARKMQTLPEYKAQVAQQQNRMSESSSAHANTTQRMFNAFDVRETSYHFFSQRIDLHLCDDEGDGRSSYPDLDKGGALQVSVTAFQVDYYPYHLAKSDRSHWAKYKEASVAPALWLKESLNAFREAVLNLSQPNRSAMMHAPLERSVPASPIMLSASMLSSQHPVTGAGSSGSSTPTAAAAAAASSTGSAGSAGSTSTHSQVQQHRSTLDNLAKLMSSCVILRIEDFTLYRVTTSGKKQMPKEFVSAQHKRKSKSSGDKDRYSFPAEMPIVHAEYTYFYYPGDFVFPLPPSKIFVHVNPLQVHFDLSSILWLNSFGLSLRESLQRSQSQPEQQQLPGPFNTRGSIASNGSNGTQLMVDLEEPSLMYMDVKVEAIMPRVVLEAAVDAPNQKDRPKTMQIQISRFALTNIREMGSSRADLAQALHSLQEGSLVFGSEFPSNEGDMCIVTDRILSHVAASDVNMMSPMSPLADMQQTLPRSASTQYLSRYAMWSEPRDVWCIKLDPIWVDFLGARSLGPNKSIPFVDAVPITLWLHKGSGQALVDVKKVSNDKTSMESMGLPPLPTLPPLPRNPFLNSDEDVRPPNEAAAAAADAETPPTDRTADVHAIAHISNLVSLQIDHYQLLFLLRLGEELNEMSTFLNLDAERILQKQNEQKSIIFGCVVPQIELTLVMPSPTPGKESSGGDAESVVPDSASLGDDLHMNSGNITWPTPPPLEQLKSNTFGSVETPSPVTQDAPPNFDSGIHMSNPNTHGYNVQIQSTPTMASSTPSQSGSRPDTGISTQSQTQSISSVSRSGKSSAGAVGRGGTGAGSTGGDTVPSLTKEINSGLMSMKKGFSSFMTSIDSAIKSGTPNDDASDTFSMQSDISSDSENYAMVMGDDKTMDCMDVMFRLNPFTNDNNMKASPVEVASEVYEEPSSYKTNMSSPSEPSEGSTWRRRDLVSMATFRLTTVELIRQQEGPKSSVRLQVAAVSCDECGAIPWDELQIAHQANKTKFGARCKAWNLAPYNPEAPPCIRLRLEETLNMPRNIEGVIDRKRIQSWFNHHAEIRVKDINLDLSMSTVIGLGDLAEDEIISPPLPVTINLENVRINLLEDRPPVNITSPGPVPINLCIGRMHLKRDKNGVLNIQPIDTNLSAVQHQALGHALFGPSSATVAPRERDRELLSMQLVMQQMKLDNDQLRKQLVDSKVNTDSYRQKTKQEADILRSYLKAAQDDISILLEEKKALLDTIRSLQIQMTSSNMSSRKNDGNR